MYYHPRKNRVLITVHYEQGGILKLPKSKMIGFDPHGMTEEGIKAAAEKYGYHFAGYSPLTPPTRSSFRLLYFEPNRSAKS